MKSIHLLTLEWDGGPTTVIGYSDDPTIMRPLGDRFIEFTASMNPGTTFDPWEESRMRLRCDLGEAWLRIRQIHELTL